MNAEKNISYGNDNRRVRIYGFIEEISKDEARKLECELDFARVMPSRLFSCKNQEEIYIDSPGELQKGEVYFVADENVERATRKALKLAERIADERTDKQVVYFSFRQETRQLVQDNIDINFDNSGMLFDDEICTLDELKKKISMYNTYCENLVCIVDSIGHIVNSGLKARSEDLQDDINHLKQFAKKKGITIVLVSR